MISLVGYTGFVGSNLNKQGDFSGLYNSKNIGEAFGSSPDVLYYSGLPAEKFLADKFPEKDEERVEQAAENILKINPKRVVLISTVDVYSITDNRTEAQLTPAENPYGANRLWLERFVEKNFKAHNIIRLPGLFGDNIKKNFIYDFMAYIPALLTAEKIKTYGDIHPIIYDMYTIQDNGFYRFNVGYDKAKAKAVFKEIGFSAINFTDSRAVFQFYNLGNLYRDIATAIKEDISVLNLATEPLSAAELYRHLTGDDFVNEFKSEDAKAFGGVNGYLYSKQEVLDDIKKFVEGYSL